VAEMCAGGDCERFACVRGNVPAVLEAAMPYRSFVATAPRTLVVQNHPTLTAVLATCAGVLCALAGFGLLAALHIGVAAAGGEVVMSAMGTVFLLAGPALSFLGVRMKRSQTELLLDRDELTVTVRAGSRSVSRHVVRVDDIQDVGLETDDDSAGATYRTQIVMRGGDSIALGQASTSARSHYERVAADIRGFLGSTGRA